jgi:hypothetical protein
VSEQAVKGLVVSTGLLIVAGLSIAAFWSLRDGPERLTLTSTGMSLDERVIAYHDIISLQHDCKMRTTEIELREGARIRLMRAFWPEHDRWISLLSAHTRERLLADAREHIARGGEAAFGKIVRVSASAVTLGEYVVPVHTIEVAGMSAGWFSKYSTREHYSRHTLYVGTRQYQSTLELGVIGNAHVLLTLLREHVERNTSSTATS